MDEQQHPAQQITDCISEITVAIARAVCFVPIAEAIVLLAKPRPSMQWGVPHENHPPQQNTPPVPQRAALATATPPSPG